MKEDFTSYIRDVLIDRPYILLGNHEPALAPALYSLITDALRGHVHPRVTGFDGAEHEDFKSLEDARSSMTRKGVEEFDEALKFQASDTATLHSRENYYYAVANGRTTGIFIDWKAVEKSTSGYKDACHQRFNTELEAREFIEDWNDAYADILRWEVRKGLHGGWKARNLKLNLVSVFLKMENEGDTIETLVSNLKRLNVEKGTKE